MSWQSIETAPKDGTAILAWCVHEKCGGGVCDGEKLCVYHSEAEYSYAEGQLIIVWVEGGFDEDPEGNYYDLDDWWFLERNVNCAVNPTHWQPLPAPPEAS